MKLAIMQPYFFPYIGYIQLINYVDKWVVFDDTQYISKGWINRNRILHPDYKKEWQYFTVPIKKHSRESKINVIEINDNLEWKKEIIGKFSHYKKKAPFYNETIDFINSCLQYNNSNLSAWVVHTLKLTCEFLQIPFNYSIYSETNIKLKDVEHAGQWALKIAAAMNAIEYINPPSGYTIFKEKEFIEKNIELRFLKPNLTPYIQRRGSFVPGLSIVDVMMWNDKDEINEMLFDCEILKYSQISNYESYKYITLEKTSHDKQITRAII